MSVKPDRVQLARKSGKCPFQFTLSPISAPVLERLDTARHGFRTSIFPIYQKFMVYSNEVLTNLYFPPTKIIGCFYKFYKMANKFNNNFPLRRRLRFAHK